MSDGVPEDLGPFLVKNGALTQEQLDALVAKAKQRAAAAAEPTVQITHPPSLAEEETAATQVPHIPPTPEELERYRKQKQGGLAWEVAPKTTPGMAIMGRAPQPPLSRSQEALPGGRRFGDYTIIRTIGRGGMGVVHEAEHTSLGRRSALKLLLPSMDGDGQLVQRFQREARAAAKLRHPNIVQVYESGVEESRLYIAMELVAGRALNEVIRDDRILPRRAATIALAAADALAFAHAAGVVHRDVKPSNIMLGEGDHVYLMDFGLAMEVGNVGLTKTGTLLGTPAYMPPEQAQCKPVDAQADVYSLGATLYEMLAGQPPFVEKEWNSLMRKIIEDEPQSVRKLAGAVPKDLETITLKAMEKPKSRRYATMDAFRMDLKRWLEGEPIQARPVSIAEKLMRKARKNRAATALGMVAVVVLSVALGLWWRGRVKDLAQARVRLGEFQELRKNDDPASQRKAWDAMADALSLSREGSEFLEANDDARHEDLVKAMGKGVYDLSLLDLSKYADKRVGKYAKEIPDLERRITGVGSLEIHTEPEGASFKLYRFDEVGLWDVQQDPQKYLKVEGQTPWAKRQFDMGQYLLIFSLPGYADTNYPIWIERNKEESVAVKLLRPEQIPEGMVYVPGGDTKLINSSTGITRRFHVESFLVSADTVTQAQYARMLQQCGDEGRAHRPKYSDGSSVWTDSQPPSGWESLPVIGITAEDAEYYAAKSGMRLPTWEESARLICGPGGRRYPWGDTWDPERLACGDSVNPTRPARSDEFTCGVSPFGCHHVVGNVSQIVTLSANRGRTMHLAVGGDYTCMLPEQFTCAPNSAEQTMVPRERTGFRLAKEAR